MGIKFPVHLNDERFQITIKGKHILHHHYGYKDVVLYEQIPTDLYIF